MAFGFRNIGKWTSGVGAVAVAGITIASFMPAAPSGANPYDRQSTLYSSVGRPYSAQNLPHEWWSLSFGGTNAVQLGDKVDLVAPSRLGSATVMLDSQAIGTGTFPVSITFTIYKPGISGGSVGDVLATQTKTFNVPYRPAGDPTACGPTSNSIFPGYSNDGTQWFDPSTGSCYYGVVDPATFNFGSSVALPSTVVYGISYDATSGPASSLNVLFSTESQSGGVTVGSDTDPGNLFVQAGPGANALGGTSGQISCAPVGTTFQEYNTAVGTTGCGTSVQQASGAPFEPIGFVPAVVINGRS